MIQFTVYETGKKESFDRTNFIKKIGFGGQGLVYLCRKGGKQYAVKFYEAKDKRDLKDIKERFDIINERIQWYKNNRREKIPSSVRRRAFPIGIGDCGTADINTVVDDGPCLDSLYCILVFEFIKGITLDNNDAWRPPYIRNDTNLLIEIVSPVLKAFRFLDQIGLVHPDLYPSNFLIDSNLNIHMFDLEGTGILDENREKLIKDAKVLGQSFPGLPRPPEVENSKVFKGTPYWSGLMIIAWILLYRRSPFEFLTAIDKAALDELYQKIDKEKVIWPPYGAENHSQLQPKYKKDNYKRLKELRAEKNTSINRLYRVICRSFVQGYKNPDNRKSFNQLQKILGF